LKRNVLGVTLLGTKVVFLNLHKLGDMNKVILLGLLVIVMCSKLMAQSAQAVFDEAMKYKARENYTETVKLLSKALEMEPTNPGFLQEQANAQYKKHAYYEAIPLYENLVKDDEENIEYLARLAEMYSMSPQKMKGIEYADRALKLNPEDGETNRKLARTFLEVEHFPKAIKLYVKAQQAMPEDKDIPYKLANCYERLADYKNAMKYFVMTVELDPDNASKLFDAAQGCHNAGQFNKAAEYYQLAEDKGFFKSKMFYENWAVSYEEMKDFKTALFYYSKAKAYSPYDRDLNFSMADVYNNLQQFDKARELLDQVLEINPDDAEAWYNKGMTYYKAGNTFKAENFFNKAFELDPSLKSLRYVKNNF
jgi:tetratricopeptide (TPR) repeat protein